MVAHQSSSAADLIEAALRPRIGAGCRRPFVLGICGAQGSGKSTVAAALKRRLEAPGLRTAILSIDDLYVSRPQRARLAAAIHPLLQTRGVPGTHDVALGHTVLDALGEARTVPLPRFNKATDLRHPESNWEYFDAPADIIIFEGWCVGARPQEEEALAAAVNTLEAEEDPDGQWRQWVNAQLGAAYQNLFSRIDMLVLLAAPSFQVVSGWRKQQEEELRRSLSQHGLGTQQTLSDAAVDRFVQHYQRLTEHILKNMVDYADITIRLDPNRRPIAELREGAPIVMAEDQSSAFAVRCGAGDRQ